MTTVACFHVTTTCERSVIIESHLTEADARQAADEINARWGAREVWVVPGRHSADHFGL